MIASLILAGAMSMSQREAITPPLELVDTWWVGSTAPKWESYKGKVVILHTYPTFCCGWDESVKLVRKTLDKWPGKVAAISVTSSFMAPEGKKDFEEARTHIKIDWPVGIDSKEKFAEKFFPGDAIRYTFTLFDKTGQRISDPIKSMDDLPAAVEKLVKQR